MVDSVALAVGVARWQKPITQGAWVSASAWYYISMSKLYFCGFRSVFGESTQ